MVSQHVTGENTAASTLSSWFLTYTATLWHDVPADFFADSAILPSEHHRALRASSRLLEPPDQLDGQCIRTLNGHLLMVPAKRSRYARWQVLRLCTPASWLNGGADEGAALPPHASPRSQP